MNEQTLIRKIITGFKRSPEQLNGVFECDAEIVRIGGEIWGMSMDEFSPEEDLFSSDNPERLGVNLVTATLSDLFAAGVVPTFFMQSLSLPQNVEQTFLEKLMKGIRETLEKSDCALCGGDIGRSDTWRFCALGIGPLRGEKPLTHQIPAGPQTLWVTGSLGDANLAALQKTATPIFELRNDEAELISRYATSCIDTSGGFLDALWLLHQRNPEHRFDIDLQKIPFAEGIKQVSARLGFPPEATLIGGAGEYELLFTAPDTHRKQFSGIDASPIGNIYRSPNTGIYLHRETAPVKAMKHPPPSPRDASSIEQHIQDVTKCAVALFGNEY